MSPPTSDYLKYHVITQRTFAIITEFQQKGYKYKHIQIDQDTQRVKIHAHNTELGKAEHTIHFPKDLNTSHLKLPQLCQDYIKRSES